jgi:hypothetical protein
LSTEKINEDNEGKKKKKKDNGYEKNMCEISFKLSSPRERTD